jgi:N-acetylmuramoyl-L-alanine amidase
MQAETCCNWLHLLSLSCVYTQSVIIQITTFIKRAIHQTFCLAICVIGFAPAQAQVTLQQVNDLRVWHSPDRSRIVFDVSADVRYIIFELPNPQRLVVDIENADLKIQLPSLQADNPHISAVRSGRPKDGVLRFVFELRKTLKNSSFVLSPNELYGHRLVVDLKDLGASSGMPSELPVEPPKNALINQSGVAGSANPAEKKPILDQRPAQAISRKLIVAIDAGHGGEDPGAIGYRGSHEKKLTLEIAKRLQKRVNKDPNMKAVLIRTGDYFIELHKRRVAARSLNADIFVSIHADAFRKKSARGFSVFALSQRGATSAMASALAAKENASDLIGGVSLADKDQVLAQVLVDLSMTNTISESVNLGGRVLKELSKLGKLHSPRVEQAGFAVLKSPDMPSILIETGFITNPDEERNLRSSRFQKKLANALYTAINGYYEQTPHYTRSDYASPKLGPPSTRSAAITSSKANRKLSSQSSHHIVKRGESLSKISAQYNVTISSLKRLNGLTNNTVFLGQKINLPLGTGATLTKPSASRKHKVRRGDTLSEIAERYGSSIKRIMSANKLRSGTIQLGQTLKIPQ